MDVRTQPMSEEDQVKPYHAKDVVSGQETAEAVADVLKHAAEREEAARQKTTPKGPPKWMLPLAMNLGVLAVYFLVAQPRWIEVNPIQPPSTSEQVESVRRAMFFGISRIEAFRQANGRLPSTLAEAGTTPGLQSEVAYEVRGDLTYILIATVGDEDLVYDSATMSPAEFTGRINLPG
jgi:hypothetical protein